MILNSFCSGARRKGGLQNKHKDEKLIDLYSHMVMDGMEMHERRVKDATCQWCLLSRPCGYETSMNSSVIK